MGLNKDFGVAFATRTSGWPKNGGFTRQVKMTLYKCLNSNI